MNKKYLILAVLLVAVFVGAMALNFAASDGEALAQNPTTNTYVLDHFKGYKILNQLPVADPFVILQDQFDQKLNIFEKKIVLPPDYFFNPVEKRILGANGAVRTFSINDTNAHLTRFPIKGAPENTLWNVFYQNQFSPATATGAQWQNLLLGPATHILVPTAKNPQYGADPNDPTKTKITNFPETLDHYKWYPVLKGKPASVKVNLRDQWGNWSNVIVLKPVAFANPVRKVHIGTITTVDDAGNLATTTTTISNVGIQHPADHLVAYRIEIPLKNYHADILNQFVKGPMEALEGRLLLVPTQKGNYNPMPIPPGTNPNTLTNPDND